MPIHDAQTGREIMPGERFRRYYPGTEHECYRLVQSNDAETTIRAVAMGLAVRVPPIETYDPRCVTCDLPYAGDGECLSVAFAPARPQMRPSEPAPTTALGMMLRGEWWMPSH